MKDALAPLLLLPAVLFAQPVQSSQPKPLAFTHVATIDATVLSARPDMTVLIVGNRIANLGPTKTVRVPKEAQVVDATGKFLIPGLWDMHVHVGDFQQDVTDYLTLFIVNGVTGVRQMAGRHWHHQWRKEIENGTLLGPRMIIASPILDGLKPIWPGSIAVTTQAEAREAVAKVKKGGADFVKVYWLLPREAYLAIAEEAKRQGIPFAGHVPFSVSASEASDAGQTSIEHLTGVREGCSTREEEIRQGLEEAFSNLQGPARFARIRQLTRVWMASYSQEKSAAQFARLKRNHTWQCPTMTERRASAFGDDPNFRNDLRLKYMPPQARAYWENARIALATELTAEGSELQRAEFKKTVEIAGMMRRAGVEFLAGTDALNPYCFPGFSLHDELALFVQAGFTPMEALQAATFNPARFFGKGKDLGTIQKGKIADLVLLEANPLEDIRNTQKINAVVVNGRLFNRTALDGLLAQVEAAANKK